MTIFGPNPGSIVSQAQSNWSGLENVFTSDDNWASSGIGGYLRVTGFNFNIPLSATINSITVQVEGRRTGGSGGARFQITKNGVTPIGPQRVLSYTNNNPDVVRTLGPELFNQTWTPEEINASGFGGMVLESDPFDNGTILYVDQLLISVDATIPVGEPRKIFSAINRASAFAAKARDYVFRK